MNGLRLAVDIPDQHGIAQASEFLRNGARGFAVSTLMPDETATELPLMSQPDKPVDWIVSDSLIPYERAVAQMEARVEAIHNGTANELVWLLEHPPMYTAGTSANRQDLLEPNRFPVHKTGRGGQYTYHGPGQRIAYVMLDLTERGRDVRKFVSDLETWIVQALATWDIAGSVREGRVGIWVDRPDCVPPREDKIAAVGIRLRRWISFHGLSLNVTPTLEHFTGIVPCGIEGHGVTSLADLGVKTRQHAIDQQLRASFEKVFERETTNADFADADATTKAS